MTDEQTATSKAADTGDRQVDVIVIGQGLAGSAAAWRLIWAGYDVVVIDAGEPETASKISAGLITPFTGQRFAATEGFQELRNDAIEYYERVSGLVGRELIEEQPAVRWFGSEEEQAEFQSRSADKRKHAELIEDQSTGRSGVVMHQAARLRVSAYLKETKEYFRRTNRMISAGIQLPDDICIGEGTARIPRLGLESRSIVFCQGYSSSDNPWFPGIPNSPAKGEMLTIAVPFREKWAVQHGTHWLAEDQNDSGEQVHLEEQRYLVGATYDRDDICSGPTRDGRDELTDAASRLTTQPYRVIGHRSAVRASMRNRKHLVQRHPTIMQMFVVNGMGSRGSLLAPRAAAELLTLISEPKKTLNQNHQRTNLTELAQKIVRRAVKPGDTVIDATAGNGHDTLFLAEAVGPAGTVIAIDIQPSAIATTRERLAKSSKKTTLIFRQEGHESALKSLAETEDKVAAVMFNLGYLPGSDKTIATKSDTTIKAIQAALCLLKTGGVITVVAYRGHEGGREESEAVRQFAEGQKSADYSVETIESDPINAQSPVMTVFRRARK